MREQRFDKIPFKREIISKEQVLKLAVDLEIITEQEAKDRLFRTNDPIE